MNWRITEWLRSRKPIHDDIDSGTFLLRMQEMEKVVAALAEAELARQPAHAQPQYAPPE
jgi:hypothetical protein